MDQRRAFLSDICANPEDDAPRLVFADWLAENGEEERGSFIRLQVQAAALPDDDPRRLVMEEQAEELENRHGKAWTAELPELPGVTWGRFHRGFVASAGVKSAKALAEQGEAMHAAAPVRELRVWTVGRKQAKALAACPALSRLDSLSIRCNEIGPQAVETILRSPHLGPLRSLSLAKTALFAEGAEMLVRMESLRSLRHLDVSSNGLDGYDIDRILGSPHLAGLESLETAYNRLDEGLAALLGPDGSWRFPRMSLNSAHLGDAGASWLATTLTGASVLTELDLGYNDLTGEGVGLLAEALHLRNLRRLDISCNPLGDAGAAALARFPSLTDLRAWVGEIGDAGAKTLASGGPSEGWN